MAMRPAVLYIPYATSSRGGTGYIIMFLQFEEGDSLSEIRNDTESSNKSDDNSTLAPLINEEEMDVISSGNESGAEPVSTYMETFVTEVNIIRA